MQTVTAVPCEKLTGGVSNTKAAEVRKSTRRAHLGMLLARSGTPTLVWPPRLDIQEGGRAAGLWFLLRGKRKLLPAAVPQSAGLLLYGHRRRPSHDGGGKLQAQRAAAYPVAGEAKTRRSTWASLGIKHGGWWPMLGRARVGAPCHRSRRRRGTRIAANHD